MSRARSKGGCASAPEQPAPAKPVASEPPSRLKSEPVATKNAAKWWRKPRVVQLNAGRVEFSMPYQVGVAAALVLVLALLASYRLGQFAGLTVPAGPASASAQVPKALVEKPTDPVVSSTPPPAAPAERTPPKPEKTEPVVAAGDNVIVLTHYHTMADLGPVQAHFAEHGIVTEIVPESGQYVLQTKQRYLSVTPGSDGYKAIQKIKDIGALYKGKAPPTYETFAPNYFSDAYGKKVK